MTDKTNGDRPLPPIMERKKPLTLWGAQKAEESRAGQPLAGPFPNIGLITRVPNIHESKTFEEWELSTALEEIRGDKHAERIRAIRAAPDKKSRDEMKRRLPAFVFQGTFQKSVINENFQQSSGIFGVDIDGLVHANVEQRKKDLAALPCVLFVFVSPSGTGIKAGIRINPESIKTDADLKRLFPSTQKYLKRHGFEIDKACKDVRRLCFVSHDPEIIINENVEEFNPEPFKESSKPAALKADGGTASLTADDEYLQYSGMGLEDAYLDDFLENVENSSKTPLERCLNLLQTAKKGERHAARLKAGMLAGGFTAGGQLEKADVLAALKKASDSIADGGETSPGEWKTILDGIENGKEEPIFSDDGKGKKSESVLAKQLADQLADQLAFDGFTSAWHEKSNQVWKPVNEAKATARIINALESFLPKGFTLAKSKAIQGFLKTYLLIEKWSTDKTLLPLENGVLNTKIFVLEAYQDNQKFNWQLPYPYDPQAPFSVTEQWFEEMTGGDCELLKIIRAFFKITLVGGDVQKILELVGPGGSGKSTLIRLLVMLIGEENCVATDLKNLETNRFETAMLYNKKLALISDSSRYGGEVSVLKAVTGGDRLRLEIKKVQQSESFVYGGTVVIVSNEAIQSTDYSSAFARRRLPVAFKKKITDADKEKWTGVGGIETVMKKELPGLLNWVLSMPEKEVNDCLKSIHGELTPALREHLIDTNKLAAWVEDNLIVDCESVLYIGNHPGTDYTSCDGKLYPNYVRWCSENGLQPMAVQRFSNNLLDLAEHCHFNVEKISRTSKGRRIKGFKIRKASDKDPASITGNTVDEDF